MRARERAARIGLSLALATWLPGQDPPAGKDAAPPTPAGRVTLDEVLALVGGRQIWLGDVQQEYDARLSGIESGTGGVSLTEQDKLRLWAEVLTDIIRNKMLASGASTLGIATPEEVERYMDNFTLEKERELIRTHGSIDNVIRELEYQDMSWDSYMAQARDVQLTNLAKNEYVARRLDGQGPLFVTKNEMRELYRAQRALFVHGPRAMLEVVVFLASSIGAGGGADGNGSDGNGSNGNGSHGPPESRALAASQAWVDGVSAQEIAERFGGIVSQADWVFSSEGEDARQPFFREFALSHAAGEVSEPIPHGGGFWVLRVSERREASNLPFEDRAVQTWLQNQLEGMVIQNLQNESLMRSQSRTYLWLDPETARLIGR